MRMQNEREGGKGTYEGEEGPQCHVLKSLDISCNVDKDLAV